MIEINLVTSNISAHFLTPPGVPAWDDRKDLYIQALGAAEPDIIGLQEVTPTQFSFLKAELQGFGALSVHVVDPDPVMLAAWREKYARFGLDDVPSPYEIHIFYRLDMLTPLVSGHWWLSPTPERPSTGFGNVAPRLVLWARFQHAGGREFTLFNTHIDHRCTGPMVELCRQQLAAFIKTGAPLVFMGDLNFNPSNLNYAQLIEDGWRDPFVVAPTTDTTTFLYDLPDIPGGRIDHILYQGGFAPLSWARIESPDPNKRLSDHDPVLVRLGLDR